MTDQLVIEPYHQKEAKKIIDMLFDAKLFNEKVTRDDLQGVEDLIAFMFQSNAKSAKRAAEFIESIKHLK